MQEVGLPESLRRNMEGQYRQKKCNRPWRVEWPTDSVGVIRLGHGLQGTDMGRGCQGRADQAEDCSLPILGVQSESFQFQWSPRRERKTEKQISNLVVLKQDNRKGS